jgi:competence protein ComEA
MSKTVTAKLLGSAVALTAALLLASALPVYAGGYGEHGKSASMEAAPSERVNLNTASVDDLARVGGIGSELARAIVEYRDVNGPFSSVDDLLKVKGIDEGALSAFRDHVTVEWLEK